MLPQPQNINDNVEALEDWVVDTLIANAIAQETQYNGLDAVITN